MYAKVTDVKTKDARVTFRQDGELDKLRDGDRLVYGGPSDLSLVFSAVYVFAGTASNDSYSFLEMPEEEPVEVRKETFRDQLINGDWERAA